MSIIIKNRWPADSNVYLQCSGVAHDFSANEPFWEITGEDLRIVLGPFNQGRLFFGNNDAAPDESAYFTVRDNQEYTLELSSVPS